MDDRHNWRPPANRMARIDWRTLDRGDDADRFREALQDTGICPQHPKA
jgi:hypothetical protein